MNGSTEFSTVIFLNLFFFHYHCWHPIHVCHQLLNIFHIDTWSLMFARDIWIGLYYSPHIPFQPYVIPNVRLVDSVCVFYVFFFCLSRKTLFSSLFFCLQPHPYYILMISVLLVVYDLIPFEFIFIWNSETKKETRKKKKKKL